MDVEVDRRPSCEGRFCKAGAGAGAGAGRLSITETVALETLLPTSGLCGLCGTPSRASVSIFSAAASISLPRPNLSMPRSGNLGGASDVIVILGSGVFALSFLRYVSGEFEDERPRRRDIDVLSRRLGLRRV